VKFSISASPQTEIVVPEGTVIRHASNGQIMPEQLAVRLLQRSTIDLDGIQRRVRGMAAFGISRLKLHFDQPVQVTIPVI
jgi:hypothetical protein